MLPRLAELSLWILGATVVLASPSVSNDQPPDVGGRSLAERPTYLVGEWWDVEVEDWFTGEKARGTFVVTAANEREVSFGVASNSIHPLLFNNRLFPLGKVPAESLAYRAYGNDLDLVDFPMTAGTKWTTTFAQFPLDASVVHADAGRALVKFRDPGGKMLWGGGNYSANLGWYEDLSIEYFAHLRVLDHGQGYACSAVFPADFESPAYREPLVSVPKGVLWHYPYVIPEGPTHAMITMLSVATTGFTRQQAVAPDGAVYQTANTAGEPFHYVYAVHEDPAGTWEISGAGTMDGFQAFTKTLFRAEEAPGKDTEDCTPAVAPRATAASDQGGGDGILGASWRLALIGAAFLARHWRNVAFASVRLFSRLEAGELALNPVRSRIIEALQSTNGLSTQDLRRRLQVGWGTVTYHLAVLERHGAVLHIRSGRRQVWASPETPPSQLGRLAVLGNSQARRVFDAIEGSPGRSQAELARDVGISPATVHHHVGRLVNVGAVKTVVEGRRTLHFPN